jgi:hypothetical protein
LFTHRTGTTSVLQHLYEFPLSTSSVVDERAAGPTRGAPENYVNSTTAERGGKSRFRKISENEWVCSPRSSVQRKNRHYSGSNRHDGPRKRSKRYFQIGNKTKTSPGVDPPYTSSSFVIKAWPPSYINISSRPFRSFTPVTLIDSMCPTSVSCGPLPDFYAYLCAMLILTCVYVMCRYRWRRTTSSTPGHHVHVDVIYVVRGLNTGVLLLLPKYVYDANRSPYFNVLLFLPS